MLDDRGVSVSQNMILIKPYTTQAHVLNWRVSLLNKCIVPLLPLAKSQGWFSEIVSFVQQQTWRE